MSDHQKQTAEQDLPQDVELSPISKFLIALFGKKNKTPPNQVSNNATDGEKQANSLTTAYVTAFTLIAVISIIVHFITTSITNIQQKSIRNSFYITQERLLVEQISSSMLKHYDLGETLDYNLLTQAIDNLEDNHQNILSSVTQTGVFVHNSPALKRFFFSQDFAMDQNIREFIEKARIYAGYEAADKSIERDESYNFVQQKAQILLQPILNQALADYQNEVISRIQFYHNLQLIGLIVILLVLIVEAVFIFRPLANHLRKYHIMLLRQALEDPLTGLSNRRAFMKRADAALVAAQRKKSPLIIALCDLDHFKSVNDTYGHDIGDRVLKHFSFVLNKTMRRSDFIGRIGGEEFALLLSDTEYPVGESALKRHALIQAQTVQRKNSTTPSASDSHLSNSMIKTSALMIF